MKKITKYITNDGTEFTDETAALNHERKTVNKLQEAYNKFTLNSYNGSKLLREYPLSTIGTWQIFGEDPNCNFGGHHHQPLLDTVYGTLDSAIRHAVSLPSWYTWGGTWGGSGGDIKPVKVKTL